MPDNIIKRASARVPPTPPSLGHNAIMLGLLEVVMLNVGHVVAVRVVALEACGRVGSVWGD